MAAEHVLLLAKLALHYLMSGKPDTDLLQAGVEREFKQKYMAGLGEGGAAMGGAARSADAGVTPQQQPHQPQLSAAYPSSGPLQGGTVVSVRGARFGQASTKQDVPDTLVLTSHYLLLTTCFGQAVSRGEITLALQLPNERRAVLVNATFVSDTKLSCCLPPSPHAGTARLSLHLPDEMRGGGTAAALSPGGATLDGGGGTNGAIEFRYYQAACVTKLRPAAGPIQGGTPVRVLGSGFVQTGEIRTSTLTLTPTLPLTPTLILAPTLTPTPTLTLTLARRDLHLRAHAWGGAARACRLHLGGRGETHAAHPWP